MSREEAKNISAIGLMVGFAVFISMFFFKNVVVWFSIFILSLVIIGASNYLYYSHFPEDLKNITNLNNNGFMDDNIDEITNVVLGGLNTDYNDDYFYDHMLNDD